jgi:hypothetical protein
LPLPTAYDCKNEVTMPNMEIEHSKEVVTSTMNLS